MPVENNYFLQDEVSHHERTLRSALSHYDYILVVNADQPEARLLSHALLLGVDNSDIGQTRAHQARVILVQENIPDFLHNRILPPHYSVIPHIHHYSFVPGAKVLVLVFRNALMDTSLVLSQLRQIEQWPLAKADCRIVLVTDSFSGSLSRLGHFEFSELEYTLAIAHGPEGSPERSEFETLAICERIFDSGFGVSVIRYANLFGPSIIGDDLVSRTCVAARNNRRITFSPEDRGYVRSYTFVCELLFCIVRIAKQRPSELTYNLTSFTLDDYEIKSALSRVVDDVEVELEGSIARSELRSSVLQRLSINSLSAPSRVTLASALERTFCSMLSNDQIDQRHAAKVSKAYRGKLETIRDLELSILDEVDSICRRHGIRYFLAGGSLLGSARHSGFIPWDDDLDIAMLRPDYERFRKIVPQELDEKFYYQSHRNSDGSHYVFDKIRVKGTKLSTAWSSMFSFDEDGVFFDVLVYDKTFNWSFLRRAHIKLILAVRRGINVRWIGRPRKGLHYRLSILALPVMRRIPWSWFHKFFEMVLRLNQGSKHAKFVVDSVGLNLRRIGGVPIAWFTKIDSGVFAGRTVPIPNGTHQYLSTWYGESYMELPPPFRRAGHKFAAIDLGRYASLNDNFEVG